MFTRRLARLTAFSVSPSAALVLYKTYRADFVRSGLINPAYNAGTFWLSGERGYWWSSRGSDTRYDGVTMLSAYSLDFTTTGVNSSNGPNARWYAYSLRCLSTVLGYIEVDRPHSLLLTFLHMCAIMKR